MALAALTAGGALSGCRAATPRPAALVQLRLAAPADGTRIFATSIAVSGSVSPSSASVLVVGRSVPVSDGSFSTRVALKPGTNLVDVLAGAPDADQAMNVVRVYRELPVVVPAVAGDSVSAAQGRLRSVGLVAQLHDTDGGLDFLLPLPRHACSTSPPAGRGVAPQSTVVVTVSKFC
ncbi:MAG: hypothetical protein ABSG43_29720 [Solirubrobacteraceae bacterium]